MFSSAYGIFSRIDDMLDHKKSLNKFKKIEIVSSIFSVAQQYETRNQLQKEKCEKHKCMETEQHATKKPMS